jgi:cysteine-rich repeat protein
LKRAAISLAVAMTIAGCSHDWAALEGSGGSGSGGTAGSGGSGSGGSGGRGGATGVCGNGKLEPGEECDDDNDTDGDGCTACKVDCSEDDAFKDPKSHHCYWPYAEPPDNHTAIYVEQHCAGLGAHAAGLGTTKEIEFVKPHLTSSVWTGGYWDGTEWGWSNQEPWSYGDDQGSAAAPWSAPANDGHRNRCVALGTDGKITGTDCFTRLVGLCERTPAVASP